MNDSQQTFLKRFQRLQRSLRQTYGLTAVGWTVLALAACVAAIAAVDYRWEVSRNLRATLLGMAAVGLGLLMIHAVWTALRRWKAQLTAAELEHEYPELGQRVRTTVQFSERDTDQIEHEGVAPTLVVALSEETSHRVQPLGIERVVPRGRMRLALGLGVASVALLVASTLTGWEWKTALGRTLLSKTPYTAVSVKPEETVVDEGQTLPLSFDVIGRPREEVRLLSRPAMRQDAEWLKETFDLSAAQTTGERIWTYNAELVRITEPMEYRVIAGPTQSATYRVDVRYPLEIKKVETTLQPPEYTGLPAKTVADGSITGLAGTLATFEVELDRVPAEAEAVLTRIGVIEENEQRSTTVPVIVDGTKVTLEMALEDDVTWSLLAKSGDGTSLPDNLFRVRVQQDQPPKVTFQEPDAELEVHTLAEILMRSRASDDYGLSRSGIAFQINNGQEHILLEEDFQEAALAAAEVEAGGPITARTRATLERTLPLEYFALTQKDSVMYYAFAEDNYPEAPHRSESDWRFIDVRPFVIQFRELDPMDGNGGAGRRPLTSLEELIRRERYTLNRTVKLARRTDSWGDKDLGTIDRLVEYQGEIASLTRELADRLAELGVEDEVDILYQAESSMLLAVDSLSVGSFENATLQERDAQQYLVEARNRLLVLLSKRPGLRNALSQVNRRLQQKLRRDRDEENLARSLVQRLQQLARNQQQTSSQALALANAMSGMTGSGTQPSEQPGSGSGMPSDNEEQPNEPSTSPSASAPGDSPMPEEPMPEDGENEPTPGGSGDPMEDSDETPQGSGETPGEAPEMPIDPQELEDRQYEAVAEAQDILENLDQVRGLTDLVRERMQTATNKADEAAGSLSRGETREAAEQTADASEQFGELAQQVQALIAREVSDRVAATRGLAAGLSRQEREAAEQMRRAGVGGDPAADEDESETPGALVARRLSERSRTIEDVMQALATLNDPDAGDVADRVAELAEAQDVAETLQRIRAAADQLRDMPEETDPALTVELEDTAERMELTAAELDRLFRSLVMPRMARLRELETRLTQAQQEMELRETEEDVAGWTREFEDLIRDLEDAEGGGVTREELFEMVENRRLPGVDLWLRDERGLGYTAPVVLKGRVLLLAEELRRQIHELILADILADRDEATPPEYERLVDKYFQVLSADQEGL